MRNRMVQVPRHHYPYLLIDSMTHMQDVQTGGRLPPEGILKLGKALLPDSATRTVIPILGAF
jgi:hypothetical protein